MRSTSTEFMTRSRWHRIDRVLGKNMTLVWKGDRNDEEWFEDTKGKRRL